MNVYVGKVVQGASSNDMYLVYEIKNGNYVFAYNLTENSGRYSISYIKEPERPLTTNEQKMYLECYNDIMSSNIHKFEKQGTETARFKSNESGKSDGSSADYYQLPQGATQLQDLISHRNMNAQMGEIFRAAYRYGMASHSDQLRDAKKIKFYIDAEIKRLENVK